MTNKSVFLIKINGFTMLIKTDPHLIVGAVGSFDINRVEDFIDTLKTLSRKLGCWKTKLTLSENHWLFNYLNNKVEHFDSLPIGYYVINKDIPYEKISFTGADYDTF